MGLLDSVTSGVNNAIKEGTKAVEASLTQTATEAVNQKTQEIVNGIVGTQNGSQVTTTASEPTTQINARTISEQEVAPTPAASSTPEQNTTPVASSTTSLTQIGDQAKEAVKNPAVIAIGAFMLIILGIVFVRR